MNEDKPNPTAEELTKLAFRIADKSALLDIEGVTRTVALSRKKYRDLASMDESMREDIEESIHYCELRGLIRHHPTHKDLVLLLWDRKDELKAVN